MPDDNRRAVTEPSTEPHLQANLLPWLHLPDPLEFDGYRFEHVGAVAHRLTSDAARALRDIAATFADVDGGEIDPVAVWPASDGDIPTFSPEDAGPIAERSRLLLVAGLCNTEYFTLRTPINASHFDLVAQNFRFGSDHMSFSARRRDGHTTMGGYKLGDVRVTRPIAGVPTDYPTPDQALLDGLAYARSSSDEQLRRIVTSSDAFRRGNRLDLADSVAEDLFWNITALEQLLVTDRGEKSKRLRAAVADLWGGARLRDRVVLEKWLTEAYDTRSEVHGRRAGSARWDRWVHALLASHAYTLAVRRILHERTEVAYQMSDTDEIAFEALPRQALKLTARQVKLAGDATPLWHRAAAAARSERTRRAMVAHLKLLLTENDDTVSGT